MTHRRAIVTVAVVGLGLAATACGRPTPSGNTLTALDNELVDTTEGTGLQIAKASSAAAAGVASRAQANSSGHDCRSGGRNGDCTAAEVVHAPNCGNQFTFGLGWATQLQAGLELYPGAKVIEAAGNDEGDCHVRIVSYASDASVKELVDWYQRASNAGFTTQHSHNGQEDVVTGTRQPQGDAFHASIAPDAAGSTVNLIVNHGS